MVADTTRTEERSGGTCNESEKDDAIGLCRRRRDSTERAGVPQTGRRLSGMQGPVPRARPPFARPASRSGWVPPLPRLFALTPILSPFPFPSPYSRPSVPLRTQPPTSPTVATSSSTTTIANYGTQAQVRTHGERASGETGTFDARTCACVYASARNARPCVYAPRRHVLSRQSVQLATNAFPRGQTDQAG